MLFLELYICRQKIPGIHQTLLLQKSKQNIWFSQVFFIYIHVSLLGDFNGRTSNDDDFILIYKNRHGDNFADFINDDLVTLDELGIPRNRNNLDKVKNGYENKQLEFCKGKVYFYSTVG